MGLDLGEKTIGVAVSDATRLIASPLELIRKSKFTLEAEQLFKLMAHRKVSALVIGLPANMDGTEGRAPSRAAPSPAIWNGCVRSMSPSGTSVCRPAPSNGS